VHSRILYVCMVLILPQVGLLRHLLIGLAFGMEMGLFDIMKAIQLRPGLGANPMDVFISHDSRNDAIVTRIHDALEAAGLDAWVDHHDITGGDDWNQRIQEAITARNIGVFALSLESADNLNTAAEYWLYLNKPGRRLYVVLTAPIPFEKFPWRLNTIQYVNLHADFTAGMETLITAIKGERPIRREDPATAQGLRLTGNFPYYHLDIPISGRDEDIDIVRHFLAEDRRLLVLVAFGGTGKTRLAAELAIQAKDFKDGVIWQTIEDTTKVDSLTLLIRDHLGMDTASEADQIWGALGSRQVLIILDNAESCPDRAAYAKRLENLRTSGGTRVVMTSREQWNETRRFNRLYELVAPGLDAAEQIVKDMAKQQGFSEQLDSKEREFAEATRQHPRLIQYAISWLHDFDYSRVLQMLYDLAGEDVEELLNDILYKTLDQIKTQKGGEQAIADLKKLLVCKGGFTDPAAEAILGSVESLRILRRWNLLHLDAGRYTPDVLVEAALEADTSAYPAHYEFYYELAEKHDEAQDYLGLDPESENLEAAFEWAMAVGDFEKAYWLGGNACSFFLANRGRFDQSKTWLERVALVLEGQLDNHLGGNLQNSLGNLYLGLTTGDKGTNLYRAIAFYEAALVYWTPSVDPLDYAMTHSNLGIAYLGLADIEDPKANLRKAIAAYETALVYRMPQTTPLDYARTQHNLGNAYQSLAGIEDQEGNLQRAIAAYETALVYRVPQIAPLSYAMTQNNLGSVYQSLAGIEDPKANLRKAIAAYETALVYWTSQTAPLDYARTQHNLGNAYQSLAGIEDQEGNLQRAVTAYELALAYLMPQLVPLDYAVVQNNLGNAYLRLAKVQDREANLHRAVTAFEEVLVYWTPEAVPEDYATIQRDLGRAYRVLGEVEKACAAWREAEKYYRLVEMADRVAMVSEWIEKYGCGSET
jgi:tetratricopeptide (TPR) repeat protein